MNNLNHFQVGGTLGSDNNSYVVRQADRELLNCLLEGNFCFVLNCRQMGKSSLMVKTADKLRGKNVNCAFSDLSVLGVADVSSEQWYKSFAYQLLESLDLDEIDLDTWWEKHNSLTAINCLELVLEKIILTQLSNNIVIFVDEIDSIIRLPFKDDFFALIRGFYNQRTIKNEYKRLTFCLLGVATPPDLIEDKVRTPFNIGYPIELSGFTVKEAKNALIPGFPKSIAQPEAILKEVIKWTGGQPFLTQKLCLLVARHSNSTTPNVGEIVRRYIVINWESQDYPQHFKTISDRLLDKSHYTLKLLELYRQILQQEKIIADDSLAQNKLRISGLVNKENNYLTVYNPIYKKIFNLGWVQEQLDNIRPYSLQINRWLVSNFSDESLLNEKSLMEALEWAEDKNITREDHQYLSASREYRSQQEVLIAKQEKNKIITQSKIFLSATIVIAGAIITGAILFANDKRDRAEISILDRDSTIALQEFDRGEQIKGLSRAITINSQLKNKINPRQTITNYSTVKPIEAINNIINQIQEKNAIELFDSEITRIAYSADGQLIGGDREGIVRVWNPNNEGVTDWDTLPNRQEITGIAVSLDGKEIYVTDWQKESAITVYNSNGEIKTLLKNNEEIYSLAISPNNQFLVSGNNLGELTLWSKDGQKIANWLAHEGTINSIAISPDSNLIATASNDTTAKLWTKEGKLITTLSGKNIGHSDSVNSIAFSPDGKTIATASNDTTIKLWNLKGSLINTLSEHSEPVNSVTFSPDGNIIVSASSDTTIRLWNKRGIQQTIRGHDSAVNSIVFNPDNNTFASTDDKGIIKIWQIDSFQSRINTGTFLRDRQQVLLNSPQVNTIQSIEGKVVKQFPNPKNKFINSIAISPDRKNVIVGTEDGIIAKLNLHSDTWQLFDKERYPGKIIAVDIHPSGEKLITLGTDESQKDPQYIIKQWSIKGNLINTFNNYEGQEITAIKYSPQGDIAIATIKGIELWDNKGNYIDRIVEREQTKNTLENITSIAFSSDNKLIATASKNGIIQMRKIDGTLLATFTKNDNRPIVHLDFTDDNKTIKAIDQYGMVSDWHLDVDTSIQKGCNWLKDYLAKADNSEITRICNR